MKILKLMENMKMEGRELYEALVTVTYISDQHPHQHQKTLLKRRSFSIDTNICIFLSHSLIFSFLILDTIKLSYGIKN